MNYDFITNAFEVVTKTSTQTVANVERTVVEVPVFVKGENGEKELTTRTLSNPVAVRAITDIEVLHNVSKMSLKAVCIAMARITEEHAKSVGLKKAKDLLKAIFANEYSDNTISKYRRIGLIFGDLSKDGYYWRDGIDQSVSVSNLDVVLTLCECEDAEVLTDDELLKVFEKFYLEYIYTDKIHLSASQSSLKKEVKEIKNPPIDVEAIEVEATEVEDAPKEAKVVEVKDTEVVDNSESAKKTATDCILMLSTILKDNKNACKLLAQLTREVDKMEE